MAEMPVENRRREILDESHVPMTSSETFYKSEQDLSQARSAVVLRSAADNEPVYFSIMTFCIGTDCKGTHAMPEQGCFTWEFLMRPFSHNLNVLDHCLPSSIVHITQIFRAFYRNTMPPMVMNYTNITMRGKIFHERIEPLLVAAHSMYKLHQTFRISFGNHIGERKVQVIG